MSDFGRYAWLANEPAPRILVEAVRLFGVAEVEGNGDNPTILSWAKELGLKEYTHDETAWCGLFLALCVKRAGYPLSRAPLWALSWATWGAKADVPKLGDVLVFERKVARQLLGHTGLYVGEDSRAFHVYGGNQAIGSASRESRARVSSLRGGVNGRLGSHRTCAGCCSPRRAGFRRGRRRLPRALGQSSARPW